MNHPSSLKTALLEWLTRMCFDALLWSLRRLHKQNAQLAWVIQVDDGYSSASDWNTDQTLKSEALAERLPAMIRKDAADKEEKEEADRWAAWMLSECSITQVIDTPKYEDIK